MRTLFSGRNNGKESEETMYRFSNTTLIIPAIVFTTTISSLQAQESARDIMIRIDERPNGNDRVMSMTMKLVSKNGKERVREMTLYSKDYGKDSKSLFYFDKPADVKGTGFLMWGYDDPEKDDDRWLYLPALKQSKRISGSSKKDSFMGSDMSYDDMGNRSVDEDTHKLMREESVEGNECWVIESIPKDGDSEYSRTVKWFRKDALLSVKEEFYDKKGDLLKTLHQSNISKKGECWVAHTMVVENVQDRHKTVLELFNVAFDTGLKDDLFRVATLERGRSQ